MSWTTTLWSMVAATCLTLAAIHLTLWFRNRTAWASLFFGLMSVGTAGMVLCEAAMMQSRSTAEFAGVIRWLHVPIFVVMVSLVGFVHVYLGAGRPWLGLTVIGLRALALLVNFLSASSLNFLEVTELHTTEFLGDTVAVAVGVPNPWTLLGQLSVWLCVAYVIDASIGAWRRGVRTRALVTGGTVVFFLAAGAFQGLLIIVAGFQLPTMSLFFIGIVAAMAYELSADILRSRDLAIELGEVERRMLLATSAANLGLWSWDAAQRDTWANSQWRELLGFAPDERVDAERVLQKAHPDDRERMRRVMAETESAAGVHHVEFRVPLADGQVRWIASQGQAEFDRHGRPIRIRGASIDCTARKRAEQETLMLRQEIAHVGRVTVMGQLASALAHEINQPLGAILRNAEAAVLFLKEESPDLDEIRAILEDIHRDDQRAGAVIERMRSLLRRQGVEKQPLLLDQLFGDVAALVRPEAVARHVRLDLKVASDVPMVAGDPVHLQQVLLNLVANGMDAIDDECRNPRSIVLSARRDGAASVQIAVSDTGRGIPLDKMDHLFEPFFTTKPRGMGMGLSISKTIVEAHGGRLWAENSAAGGASFLFTVPSAQGLAA